MVQILAYFEHIQIVQKLEPTKNFSPRLPDSFLHGNFASTIQCSTPDIPVNTVAVHHRLDGEKSMH